MEIVPKYFKGGTVQWITKKIEQSMKSLILL